MKKSQRHTSEVFLLTPLREGRLTPQSGRAPAEHFYSRPCGRGDPSGFVRVVCVLHISTHAPAGGATVPVIVLEPFVAVFLLTPLREGRHAIFIRFSSHLHFYSRPCGRGDKYTV